MIYLILFLLREAQRVVKVNCRTSSKGGRNLSYIALSEKNINDKKWQVKINLHRKRRPKDWKSIETTDLLTTLSQEDGPLLIDSISGFVMENIEKI